MGVGQNKSKIYFSYQMWVSFIPVFPQFPNRIPYLTHSLPFTPKEQTNILTYEKLDLN